MGEAFILCVDLVQKRGWQTIKDLVVQIDVDSTWKITFNGCPEERQSIAPFHILVEYNGFPAGIIGPGDGVIAAGERANEDAFIAALKAAGAETH